MSKTLDQSHRTVLLNLETSLRAQICFEETKEYLWSVLAEVADEFPGSDDPKFSFRLDKRGFL